VGREHPLRQALVDRRCRTADEVAAWIVAQAKEQSGQRGPSGPSGQGKGSTKSTRSTKSTKSTEPAALYPEFSANAALVLIAVACSLLDRQVASLAKSFEEEGGFTERLYRVRTAHRRSTQAE
jgi:four helix bundle suffix protein